MYTCMNAHQRRRVALATPCWRRGSADEPGLPIAWPERLAEQL